MDPVGWHDQTISNSYWQKENDVRRESTSYRFSFWLFWKSFFIQSYCFIFEFGNHSMTLTLTGQPVPRVIWYEDGRAVEGLLEYLPNKQIRNVLQIAELSRANHNVRYSCAASNSRILPPLVSAITVFMRRKSLSLS